MRVVFSATASSRGRRAFTLIEVLVVVAILALLVAILLPSLKNARVQARRAVCLSNMHQLGVGIGVYMGEFRTRPPQWPAYAEPITDGVALWAGGASPGGGPVRLGMLYPRYIGKNENVFYCPDASDHPLLGRDGRRTGSGRALYPWSNWGKDWTYGSYEYRPRYWINGTNGQSEWIGIHKDFRRGAPAIAADGFSGPWHHFGGPYPVHSPVAQAPKMLYYNVSYVDGSGKAVKDFVQSVPSAPNGKAFRTRAGPRGQSSPYVTSRSPSGGGDGVIYTLDAEYTHLWPNAGSQNQPLPPPSASGNEQTLRNNLLNGQHIDRAWTFFDTR